MRLVIVGSGSRLAWLKSQQQALGLSNLILAGRSPLPEESESGETVGLTEPADIIPAIRRGIEQTENGTPALLEFITSKENTVSTF